MIFLYIFIHLQVSFDVIPLNNKDKKDPFKYLIEFMNEFNSKHENGIIHPNYVYMARNKSLFKSLKLTPKHYKEINSLISYLESGTEKSEQKSALIKELRSLL